MNLMETALLWVFFNVFIVMMLLIDLFFVGRRDHIIQMKEALIWSGLWVVLALLFNAGIFFFAGSVKALEFLTGYLVERSLSIDNLFVFYLVFSYFQVPSQYQHRVLFWGVFGALVMRAAFIFAGIQVIEMFSWAVYILGGFLIVTGLNLAFQIERKFQPDKNLALLLFQNFFSVQDQYLDGKFFIRRKDRLVATPLFVALIVIESTDVIFALDSIPAIIAITSDPFLVYSSNVFALLGLRAMYFALYGLIEKFRYLNYGLASILVLLGLKMILEDVFPIPVWVSLIAVVVILMASILYSLAVSHKKME